MTAKEELQKLLGSAETVEVKAVLTSALSNLEVEAKAAVAPLEAHIEAQSSEIQALWAKVKGWFHSV